MLTPGKPLEHALRAAYESLGGASKTHWLCFGGLWGLVKNNGSIPDDDLDFCVPFEEQNAGLVAGGFKGFGYDLTRTVLSDIDGKTLYQAYRHEEAPHICVSYWYKARGFLWYCHDENSEIGTEPGVPPSGYFFKGIPESCFEWGFRAAEWPGIPGATRVMVPRLPGAILDLLYPDWSYIRQRCQVTVGVIDQEHIESVYQGGGVTTPYRVHLASMTEWGNDRRIDEEMALALEAYGKWMLRTKR